MPQTPAQNQPPQTTPAPQPPAAREARRTPPPTVPPEFDALPIWKMDAAEARRDGEGSELDGIPEGHRVQEAGVHRRQGRDCADGRAARITRNSRVTPASAWSRIPIPSVDEAFRAALPKLKRPAEDRRHHIRSACARTPKALDALTKLIDDSDPQIAGAAAASVGMIGGMQAARALQAALGRTTPPVFPVVARACLLCAESLTASNRARSLELYKQLSGDNMPKPVRLAALRVLNAAGPAPETGKKWPAPTGEAAARDKSGFLGR